MQAGTFLGFMTLLVCRSGLLKRLNAPLARFLVAATNFH